MLKGVVAMGGRAGSRVERSNGLKELAGLGSVAGTSPDDEEEMPHAISPDAEDTTGAGGRNHGLRGGKEKN